MQITSPTELRKKMKSTLDIVSKDKETVIIHRPDNEDVVMITLSEYNSWMETKHLLLTDANQVHLKKSISQAKKGEVEKVDVEELWM